MKDVATIRHLEQQAIADGTPESELMAQAGESLAQKLWQHYGERRLLILCVGKGHNGGDALVAATHLAAQGWEIVFVSPFPPTGWADLSQQAWTDLRKPTVHARLSDWSPDPRHNQPTLLLDGLLGIGSRPGLRGDLASLADEMENWRQRGAQVIALDLPSGMDADSGATDTCAVRADLTLTIGTLKPGLVADQAINFVGRLDIVPFPLFDDDTSSARLATAENLRSHWHRRPFDFHKGKAGRLAIIAGAPGFLGAARLCSEAALRAGAGLVTLFVPEESYPHIVGAIAPEIMVRGIASLEAIEPDAFDAFAVGPGLGENPKGFFEFLKNYHGPIVLDADGLNLVAREDPARWLREGMVVTPHPGEMKRLFPHGETLSRQEVAQQFVAKHPVTLLYKGARTIVAKDGQPLSYNGTGNPGMAGGGQGDVLTGIIAALMVQGLSGYHAARLGAWLAGKSADLCLQSGTATEETLVASDVSQNLAQAFSFLHN